MEITGNNTVTESTTGGTEATAAAVEAQTAASGEAVSKETAKQEPAAKTYDQAYVDKLLADNEAARAAAVAEALKVSQMDEDGKASYEQEKRAKELSEREAQIALRERKAEALDVLDKNEVPREFLDMLVGESTEETKEKVAAFKKEFDAAVQKQVEKRLAGTTPKGGNGTGAQSEDEAMAAEIAKYL